MTKQVKVFNGSVADKSQTVYTVPAGRVAKVTAATVNLVGSSYGATTLVVGGETVANAPGGSTTYYRMPASELIQVQVADGNQVFVDPNMRLASISVYSTSLVPFKGTYYLNAGQTIQINMSYQGNSATWSFLVVEEY